MYDLKVIFHFLTRLFTQSVSQCYVLGIKLMIDPQLLAVCAVYVF